MKTEERPLILVTNDDGFDAKGITALMNSVRHLGDVIVVAPDSHRSGQSSAITVNVPIRAHKLVEEEGFVLYKCTGTPVDCVKLAFDQLCPRKPDIILSGINHGSNASISILYSGTMAAALEGAVYGIPAIGFSLCDLDKDADFCEALPYVQKLTKNVLENGLDHGISLNVNFPKGKIKGMKVCRQARGSWTEEFLGRKDPHGRDYFWLTGYFVNREPDSQDTDEWMLAEGIASIVPCHVDLTAYEVMSKVKDLIGKE